MHRYAQRKGRHDICMCMPRWPCVAFHWSHDSRSNSFRICTSRHGICICFLDHDSLIMYITVCVAILEMPNWKRFQCRLVQNSNFHLLLLGIGLRTHHRSKDWVVTESPSRMSGMDVSVCMDLCPSNLGATSVLFPWPFRGTFRKNFTDAAREHNYHRSVGFIFCHAEGDAQVCTA